MFNGVASHTDDRIRRQQLARNVHGHVGLAEMDAICANRERDVDTVIDEDGNVVPATDLLRCPRNLKELRKLESLAASGQVLVVYLPLTSPVSACFSRIWTTVTPPLIAYAQNVENTNLLVHESNVYLLQGL